MALDTSIFAQYLRPARSVADYDAEYQGQQRNALLLDQARQGMAQREAKMRADEQAAAMAAQERNALAQALQGIDPSTMEGQNALMRAAPNQAMGYLKDYADVQGKFATAGKSTADAAATKLKTARQQFEYAIQGLQVIPDAQTAAQYIRDGVSKGVWSMQDADGMVRTIPQDPAQFQAWRATQLRQILEAEKQLPKIETRDAGGTVQTLATDAVTGQPRVMGSVQKTATPEAMMADKRAREQEGRMWAQFNYQKGRDAVADGAAVADAGGPSQAALVKRLGKPQPGYWWKADGSAQEPIPGGPADRKSNEQMAGKETVDNVVAALRSSYDALDTGGGITSTNKGAIENIGAAISRSGVGQAVGGAVGSRNQKERDAIAQARPLLLQAIMKATGMSAKQMDSNAELKLYLATATDPTLSLEANREALARIEQLYGSGALTPKTPGGNNTAGPQPGTVEGGYRFKGGDAGNPKNWEKL